MQLNFLNKKFTSLITSLLIISSCGGGGSGGGSDEPRMSVSRSEVSFNAVEGGESPNSITIQATFFNLKNNIYVGYATFGNVIRSISIDDRYYPTLPIEIIPESVNSLIPGINQGEILIFACNDTACNSHISGSPFSIRVSYTISGDRDGDGHTDSQDAFPDNPDEWLDVDNDGIGDNADPIANIDTSLDEDGDGILDIDDPRPLNPMAPGTIYSISPGSLVANSENKVMLFGENLSHQDRFYIDGVEVNSEIVSDVGVYLDIPDVTDGEVTISIEYDNHSYRSTLNVASNLPTYYPYSVVTNLGEKSKGYFDSITQSLYVFNETNTEITRYIASASGLVESATYSNADIDSFALSPDLNTLYTLQNNGLIELDKLDLSSEAPSTDKTFVSSVGNYNDFEFDYMNRAYIFKNDTLAVWTDIIRMDLEPLSDQYLNNSVFFSKYSPTVAISRDGNYLLQGHRGISTSDYELYNPASNEFTNIPFSIFENNFNNASISQDGSKILINDFALYTQTFERLGFLNFDNGGGLNQSTIDAKGEFVIGYSTSRDGIHWYDVSGRPSGSIIPQFSADLPLGIGNINNFVLSQDGLTLFILTDESIVMVPVWQIIEDNIGSSALCPTSGC